MPYNFETTFTQPILAKLDSGEIKGADDWADIITRNYIETIKAGLPQGLAPVLPAPGLAVPPSPPPPFTIGASPFLTANARSRKMYTIIRAYFRAEELKLNKAAIEGLAADIKLIINKIKTRTDQVKSLIQTIRLVNEQLRELPQIISDITQDIKDEIKSRINSLKSIELEISKLQTQLDPTEFNNLFRKELQLIQTIKNFDPTNIRGLREMSLLLSEYGQRTNPIIAAGQSNEQIKNYISDKLFAVGSLFLELAKGVTDPTSILDFVNQIKADSQRLNRLYNRLKQADVFVRFIQPKLKRLETRKNNLIRQIRTVLQQKLADLRKRLDNKIAEYTKRKQDSKSQSLYTKASKIANDVKSKYQKQIKKYDDKVKLLQKGLRLSVTITGQITSLVEGVKFEFEDIKKDIERQQAQVNQTLQNANQALNQPLQTPSTQILDYFNGQGLGDFANLGALVITQTKCDLQTFKIFFEQKRNTIKQYALTITDIKNNIIELQDIIKQVTGDAFSPVQKLIRETPWIVNRIDSLNNLLKMLTKSIQPKIKQAQTWIKNKIKELRIYVDSKLKKAKDDVTNYLISLIPLKSDVNDPKARKAELESKIKVVKEKAEKLKSLGTQIGYITKASKSFVKFYDNLSKGNYSLADNQILINDMVDGIYGFRTYNQSSAVVQSLTKEKQKVKDRLTGIQLIEALVRGLILTIEEAQNTKFSEELRESLRITTNPIQINSINTILDILNNPPKNTQELKDTANKLALDVTIDIGTANKIVQLETKYLNKSRAVIQTLCDVKQLQGTRTEKVLLKVKDTINKKQSFLLYGLTLLKDEVNKFILYINKSIKSFIDKTTAAIKKRRDKVAQEYNQALKKEKDKKVNLKAPIMSFTFGLAARVFWTGARWIGPTGTQHTCLSIGVFKPIKARYSDGASILVREMARGFQTQLAAMIGVALPVAATGIPPLSFTGYK